MENCKFVVSTNLFFVILGLTISSASLALKTEEIAESAIPSVVQIVIYDITGSQRGQGSGFFITPKKIVTNAHVVEGAYSAEVFTDNGYYDQVTILSSDEDVDLAVISVNAENEVPLQINQGAELKPGQRVIAIGNPLGLEKTLSDGLISAVRKIEHLQLLQITAPISPGSSGGPLLDENGQVIGVVSATIHEGQNLNFAIGTETLSIFMSGGEHPEELKVAGSRVMWRAIVKWILAVVVGLIALLFSEGGGFVIFIVIIIIVPLWYALSWICKTIYRLCTIPFKKRTRPAIQTPNESQITSPLNSRSTYDDETMDEDEESTIHCWKCGYENYFDPAIDKEIMCIECDTSLPIPRELQMEE